MQIKERVTIAPGETLRVRDVADVFGGEAGDIEIPCPKKEGVWRLPAIAVAQAIGERSDGVLLLGESQCYVHVVPDRKRSRTHALRAVIAFLLLLIGSAFAITWFHADVDMEKAQMEMYRMISGRKPSSEMLIAVPYALGVGLGVALYYAMIGRRGSISPLDIKLKSYRKSAEETEGTTP